MLKKYTRFLLLMVMSIGTAVSAPVGVEYFKVGTWSELQVAAPKPHVVVFSTTDCAHCPGVIADIAKKIKEKKNKIYLSVVVMDGASQLEYLLSTPHYLMADRVYVFDGQSNAIRYAVNPSWRGLTPYVAVLSTKGEVNYVLGKLSRQQINMLGN